MRLIANLAAFWLLCVFVLSCSGSSSLGGVPDASAGLPALGRPSELAKQVRAGKFEYQLGSEFQAALPHQLVAVQNESAVFTPDFVPAGAQSAAYAVYALNLAQANW